MRHLTVSIVDNGVALHVVIGTVQLHILDTDDIVTLGVVVATLRLDDVIVMHQHTATRIVAYA